MGSRVEFIATDKFKETRKKEGRMQIIGVDAGGAFPLESSIYIRNDQSALKPGKYFSNSFKRGGEYGSDIVVSFFLDDCLPV